MLLDLSVFVAIIGSGTCHAPSLFPRIDQVSSPNPISICCMAIQRVLSHSQLIKCSFRNFAAPLSPTSGDSPRARRRMTISRKLWATGLMSVGQPRGPNRKEIEKVQATDKRLPSCHVRAGPQRRRSSRLGLDQARGGWEPIHRLGRTSERTRYR